MQKESDAKDKEQQQAARALQQIEAVSPQIQKEKKNSVIILSNIHRSTDWYTYDYLILS